MIRLLVPLSPTTGHPLQIESEHALTDGVERWPVVAGIPYLRTGREDVRREALAALDHGAPDLALALLLADQDPFAPEPPPSITELLHLIAEVNDGRCGLRQAMERLHFGPVADYFAVRTSTPTFLSGLGLLSQCGGGRPVVEVACGIGQLLREPCRRGAAVAGIDLVFSKLWLARMFVVPDAQLICGNACGPLAQPTTAVTVLCHDAFYFFADKVAAAAALMRLAGAGGRVLVGHAHNAYWSHGVAGNLLTPQGYAELFRGSATFDDAAFATAHLTGTPAVADHPAAFEAVEAVSLAWVQQAEIFPGRPDAFAAPTEGTPLVLNPLLEVVDGKLTPRWPSPRFAAEYRTADYLIGEPPPPDAVLDDAEHFVGSYSPETAEWLENRAETVRLARKRVLLPMEDAV